MTHLMKTVPMMDASFFDEIMNEFFEKPTRWIGKEKNYPMNVVKIVENGEITAYRLEYALAGFSKKDIKISISGDNLQIEANHNNKENFDDNNYEIVTYNGISYKSMKMTYKLMQDADKNKIVSNFIDGLLSITIPVKKENEYSTVIDIQ